MPTVTLRPVGTVADQFDSTPVTTELSHHTLIDETIADETDYLSAGFYDKHGEFLLGNLPDSVDRILTLQPKIHLSGHHPSAQPLFLSIELRLNGVALCSVLVDVETNSGWDDLPSIFLQTAIFDVNVLKTDWNASVKTIYWKVVSA